MQREFKISHLVIGNYNILVDDEGAIITHLSGSGNSTQYRLQSVKSVHEFLSKHTRMARALAGLESMDIMQPFRVDVEEHVTRRPRRRRRA